MGLGPKDCEDESPHKMSGLHPVPTIKLGRHIAPTMLSMRRYAQAMLHQLQGDQVAYRTNRLTGDLLPDPLELDLVVGLSASSNQGPICQCPYHQK